MPEDEIEELRRLVAKLEHDNDELRRLAAAAYGAIADVSEIEICVEPTGSDDACPPDCDCSNCEWRRNPLRDDLLKLGVTGI